MCETRVSAPAILVRDRINADDIAAIARGEALALRIDGYYSQDDCATLADRLMNSSLWSRYGQGTGAESIAKIGDSLSGCLGQSLCPDYFEAGQRLHPAIRDVVHPYTLPMDRVLLELDYAWPHGTGLLRVGTRPALLGLVRRFDTGGAALPHTDRADWDYPCAETAGFSAQLFANVYLAKTARGGSLRLWDQRIGTRAEYEELRVSDGHYALDGARLPEAAIEIDIPIGSLVIANAWKVHAVTECGGDGTRLSVSGFIGYASEQAPLRMFS